MNWRDTLFFGLGPMLTDEQEEYVDSIFQNQLTIVDARAGTGKTTLAVAAAKLLGKKLIYVFSPTEENKLGYRPGTTAEKEADYLQPLRDALIKINENPDKVIFNRDNPSAVKNGSVWVYPQSHVFARGVNFENCTVIIDEAQNFIVPDLKKVLTRIHDDCKVIVIGHTGQCDLNDPSLSGFPRLIEHFRTKPYAKICHLTKNFRGRLSTDADEL